MRNFNRRSTGSLRWLNKFRLDLVEATLARTSVADRAAEIFVSITEATQAHISTAWSAPDARPKMSIQQLVDATPANSSVADLAAAIFVRPTQATQAHIFTARSAPDARLRLS